MGKTLTEKVFYTNPYRKLLSGKILEVDTASGGHWLLLDKTLFYPGGGGQAADRGTINGLSLQQIRSDENGIWHLLDKERQFEKGEQVELELDWERRYYQMQQHTGQHLLSHILFTAGLNTVSVHLGDEYTLIEVDGKFPDEALLHEIETKANSLIRAALPVKTHWTDKTSVQQFPLRREAGDHDILRVVEIDGRDYSACAGTHLENTAQIGLIKWISLEKIRKRARLKFLIGERAYTYFSQLHQMQNSLKEVLHNDFTQFAERLKNIQQNVAAQKKEIRFYRNKYLDLFAKVLAQKKEPVVLQLAEEMANDAAEISRKIAKEYSLAAFIYTKNNFFMALPSGSFFDGLIFLEKHSSGLRLKGGGSADYIQGRIGIIDEARIKKAFLEFLDADG